MVKNKALPDSARPYQTLLHPLSGHSFSLSLSFSLADLALSRLVSHVFSLSLADAVHPEGNPWILPRLDPGSGWCLQSTYSGQCPCGPRRPRAHSAPCHPQEPPRKRRFTRKQIQQYLLWPLVIILHNGFVIQTQLHMRNAQWGQTYQVMSSEQRKVNGRARQETGGSGLKNPKLPESSQQSPFLGKVRGSVVSPCRLLRVRAFVLEVKSWSGNDVPINFYQTNIILCSDRKGPGPKAHLHPLSSGLGWEEADLNQWLPQGQVPRPGPAGVTDGARHLRLLRPPKWQGQVLETKSRAPGHCR